MYVLLILLSLSVAAVSAAQSPQPCSSKDMKNYTINSTSSLVDLAANTLRCAVIKVTADDITLTQLITFKDLFNVSMIGQSQLTEISCSNNSGFKFVDSELVFISNIQFSGCSLIDTVPHSNHSNSHADQAALYVYNSSNITIADCHFINNPATGLMLHEVTGSNHILSCNFSLNKPKLEHEELNVTCGGLIIYRDKRTERASYVVDSCIFADNKNTLEYLGGGMSVLLSANGSNSSISINNSIFMDNVGYVGGGLFLVRNKPLYGVVDIYNTTFLSNVAIHEGGGLETVNMDVGTFCLHLYNCVFDSNFAAFGGGISGYVPPFGEGRVNITAHSTNWTRNGASTSGFAVALYEDASFDQVHNIQLTLEDCSVFNNSLANFNSSKNAVGAIYVYGSTVTFRGSNEVSNNYGSALYLMDNGKAVFDRSMTTFSHNKASRGGAVTLQSSSTLHFATSEVTVYFAFNSATEKGGAIYAELEEDDPCLFDSNFLTTRPTDSVVWFIHNYANNLNERQDIYISGNDPRKCINTIDNSTYLRTEFFKYKNESNSSVLFDADTVQLQHNNSIKVMLGENFYLDPVILDRFGHETTTSAHVSLTYKGIDYDMAYESKLKFSYAGPSLVGLGNHAKNNEGYIKGLEVLNSSVIYLQILFEKNTAGKLYIFLGVTVELTPCRLGFVYNHTDSVCKCFMSDFDDQMFCPNSSLACVRNGYWFGNTTNGYFSFICDNQLCNYAKQKCPTDVCPNAPDFCIVNNTDDLCYVGRGGILCSRCQESYAFTFAGYRCVPDYTCKAQNSALILLGVFLFWILLICLVFIILHLNFSFGTGFASGIIYYFSIVFVLTDSVLSDNSLSIILNLSVAVTQLCARLFGQIPVCFFKHWDYNLHHQMFKFVSPLFVVATILAIICFFRYCKCPKRLSLVENSPNHAICLLILSSYTSMTYTCFEILRPISINGTLFVYIDPEIPYFDPRHLPYALFAIFVELFVSLPICFLLLFAPCLSRLSRVNLVKLRLKPIVDEYQACYKANHRWYAGFYFLARQLMYLANWMPVQVIPQSNSLFQLICVVVLLVQTLVQPYKKQFWYLNMVDTLLLTDLLLLSFVPISTSLNATRVPGFINIIQVVTPYVLILLPSLYVFGIIFLLLVRYIRRIVCKSCCAQNLTQNHGVPVVVQEDQTTDEVYLEDSEDEMEIERSTITDSFFKDPGEREPLLKDAIPPAAAYLSAETHIQRKGPKKRRGFTTTSVRVSGSHDRMESFPPAPQEVGKERANNH